MSPKDSPHSPSAMANQQYCLKWNNHQTNLLRAFDRLLQSESFTDVTLACDGRSLRAHKVVLSACSSYFEQLFEEHSDKTPIVILKDMKFTHVSQLVNFMYRGEINITQDQLSGLLKTAETLKVKGLAEVSGEAGMAAGMAAAGAPSGAPPQPMPIAPTPQQMPVSSSPLTTALNAPTMPSMSPMTAISPMTSMASMPGSMSSPLTGPPLAPLAALLHNPGAMQQAFDERRVNLLKRMAENGPDHLSPPVTPDTKSIDRPSTTHFLNQLKQDRSMAFTPKIPRRDDETGSPKMPPGLFMSTDPNNPSAMNNVLTPIPPEVTVNAQQELPDFLKPYQVFRLNDYLGFRTRQQFWEEPAVRRILEGIKNKEIDMKSAAELLGVSYGTLYGRYREVFGYLKHSWVNKPGRTPGSANKERSIWEEARAQELIQRVLNKELSLTAAAVRLGVDTNTFFTHITDNGKNKALVALLLGKDNNKENTQRMILPHNIFMDSMGPIETIGIDCEPEHPALMSEDSNNGHSHMGSPAPPPESILGSLHPSEQHPMVTLDGQDSADYSQHGEMNGERDPLDVECSVGIIEDDDGNVENMDNGANMPRIQSVEHVEENGEEQPRSMETLQQEQQMETVQQPQMETAQQEQPQVETLQQSPPPMETLQQQQPQMESLIQPKPMESLIQPKPMESLIQPQPMESLIQPRPMESLIQPRAMETLLQQPPVETLQQQQATIESYQQPSQMENFQLQQQQQQVETYQQQPPMETFQAMVDSDPVGIHAES